MPPTSATPTSSAGSIGDVKQINIGQLIFDVALCAVVAFLFTVVPALAISPYRRGFFCDDDSIRYPYKHETIPSYLLAIIIIVIVGLTIGFVELYRFKKPSDQDTSVYRIRERAIHRYVVRFWTFASHCVLCVLVSVIIYQATKFAVGRLRPNFIAVCKPNVNMTACELSREYITDYECMGEDKSAITDSRLSFFSGHSTLAMCSAVYLVLYLQARLPRRTYGVSLLPLLQTILLIGAFLVGYSRIDDNMHHWSDVLAGFAVGGTAGVVSAVYFAQLFKGQNVNYRSTERLPLIDGNVRELENNSHRANVMPSLLLNGHRPHMVTTVPIESAGL